MKLVRTSDIEIRERQRRTMQPAALEELAASIFNKGLLHAIVVRKTNGLLILVAGQRRLLAVQALHEHEDAFFFDGQPVPRGKIPCALLTDLDDIQYREAELEENILREDLSWQDRVAAVDELHRLRVEQDPEHTVKDTAREISKKGSRALSGKLQNEIAHAQLVAPHLDDPEVKQARSAAEAFSIVERKIRAAFSSQLLESQRGESQHTFVEGDLIGEMAKLPAEHFTCIIADPPYGIGADKFGDAAKKRHLYKDKAVDAWRLYKEITSAGAMAAAPEAHLYLFCDIDSFVALRDWVSMYTDWSPRRAPLVWFKGTSGHLTEGVFGFRRSYELILFASKGNKKCNSLAEDTFRVQADISEDRASAAQKPVDLYKMFLKLSCLAGDAVLDPCCGGGTIFPAAESLGLSATGIELDKELATHCRGVIAGLLEGETE